VNWPWLRRKGLIGTGKNTTSEVQRGEILLDIESLQVMGRSSSRKKARRKVKVKRVLGDGGYDTHDNFKFLATSGIKAAR
jgi:hypothetical protein